MGKRQSVTLCLCGVPIYAGISGMAGLMPVYLEQLGSSSAVAGLFLASAYLSLALSSVLGGWIAGRLQRRKPLLIAGGLVAVPTAVLMSAVSTLVPLLLLTGCLWFATGIAMTMINIMAGLSSRGKKSGRTFGVLAFGACTGLLLGSLCSGPIVDAWGYPALFIALAVLYLIIPLAGLFLCDASTAPETGTAARHSTRAVLANRTFLLVFIGSIVAQAANSLIFLGSSLSMHALQFDATAITTASAIGQVATLPLTLLVGIASDRLGRKPLLIGCFLATAPGLLVLAFATQAWQFWLASALQTVLGRSITPGSALMTDIFPDEDLGTALALLNATPWIGIVLGLSGGGIAISLLHMTPTLLLCMLFSLLATLIILPIPVHARYRPMPAPRRAWS